jgi:hypothetical protein
MRLFAKKDGKKRWKEKALLINPHKTRIIFITSKQHARPIHSPPWIREKLEEFACNLHSQNSHTTKRISMLELAFVNRIRQENNLEDICSGNLDCYASF